MRGFEVQPDIRGSFGMERITISLKAELAHQFDTYIHSRGYSNRSEAMRDLIRDKLETERLTQGDASFCAGILSYVYDHHEYDLPTRLASIQHMNHEIIANCSHVHLSPGDCLETLTLRGPVEAVRALSDRIIAERGVRHGRLHMIPSDPAMVVTTSVGATHGYMAHAEANGVALSR